LIGRSRSAVSVALLVVISACGELVPSDAALPQLTVFTESTLAATVSWSDERGYVSLEVPPRSQVTTTIGRPAPDEFSPGWDGVLYARLCNGEIGMSVRWNRQLPVLLGITQDGLAGQGRSDEADRLTPVEGHPTLAQPQCGPA
jgi:hypothetical protein